MDRKRIGHMLIGLFCGVAIMGAGSLATTVVAGSESDPIVTKGYVDKKMIELEKRLTESEQVAIMSMNSALEAKLTALETKVDTVKGAASAGAGDAFILIQAKKGDFITIADAGMFIMRSGVAEAVASTSGGLSNLTDGVNLATGNEVKANHLILIPKNDGRGIKMIFDGWVMIKGSYKIQTVK